MRTWRSELWGDMACWSWLDEQDLSSGVPVGVIRHVVAGFLDPVKGARQMATSEGHRRRGQWRVPTV